MCYELLSSPFNLNLTSRGGEEWKGSGGEIVQESYGFTGWSLLHFSFYTPI